METTTHRDPRVTATKACAVCGNQYDKTLEIMHRGRSYVFDCFECAIHQLAPQCAHCHCRVIGHGIEAQGTFYCCAHCARAHGNTEARDRVD